MSLRLDGELSELEGHWLDAHLARCRVCRRFESSVTSFTSQIRHAVPELPSHPVAPPLGRRRVLPALVQARASAALVLVVMGVGSVLATLGTSEPTLRRTEPTVLAPEAEDRMYRSARRETLVQEGMARPPRQGAQP